jgi:hypothetical protein
MAGSGHERRIRANAPAAGRPQTADPAGGRGGFRLGPFPPPALQKILEEPRLKASYAQPELYDARRPYRPTGATRMRRLRRLRCRSRLSDRYRAFHKHRTVTCGQAKLMVFADVVTVPDFGEAVSQVGGVIEYFTLP